MDCAPLNLAHFHERRANRFLQRHRYDDAYKAVETSLIYLQDAFKAVQMQKSLQLLNTQKWEYERKLSQIKMHQQQHESWKHKEIVPATSTTTNPAAAATTPIVLLRTDSNLNAQSVAKSIDKTIREFDSKLNIQTPIKRTNSRDSKELKQNSSGNLMEEEGTPTTADTAVVGNMNINTQPFSQSLEQAKNVRDRPAFYLSDNDEIPSLTPLELPSFECNSYSTSSMPAMADFHPNYDKE